MPREYGAPQQIKPKRLGDYLDVMSKSVFQSGMSWQVVESKWPGTREAFWDFDADRVAGATPQDIDTLAEDKRLIRNRRKIEAVIGNAQRLQELEATHGSFAKYLESHDDFEATVKDLRKNFKFLGDFGAYIFLYTVGQPVPEYEAYRASRDPAPAKS